MIEEKLCVYVLDHIQGMGGWKSCFQPYFVPKVSFTIEAFNMDISTQNRIMIARCSKLW